MKKEKDLAIRSSTEEFLVFSTQSKQNGIEVHYADETLWMTQKMMAELFDVEAHTITYHLGEIFKTDELFKEATTRKFRAVQTEGQRQVSRDIEYYNLDAIISADEEEKSVNLHAPVFLNLRNEQLYQ